MDAPRRRAVLPGLAQAPPLAWRNAPDSIRRLRPLDTRDRFARLLRSATPQGGAADAAGPGQPDARTHREAGLAVRRLGDEPGSSPADAALRRTRAGVDVEG